MPSVILKLFPPVIAAILITGAIAAMISTADSLLILSATELSGSLLKKVEKHQDTSPAVLRKHRLITGIIAVIALLLSYVSPSKIIFTLVSYVWAGIGCTFSVVILLTLFWKRFHGKAAVATIVTGILFTIFWVSGGFEQHYRVTSEKADFLASQNIISNHEKEQLLVLEGRKFVNSARLADKIREQTGWSSEEKKIAVVSSAFAIKSVPARLTTFIACLVAAVISVLLMPQRKDK